MEIWFVLQQYSKYGIRENQSCGETGVGKHLTQSCETCLNIRNFPLR